MEISSLFVNLLVALAAACIGALVAARLRQSLLIGFIFAGIAIGPYTPGFVADHDAVAALADIGVVFLLFAVGLDLSLRDLIRSGPVAIIGGLIQVGILIVIGYGVGLLLGWPHIEALFFGAVISNSSSTVISKVLGERGQTDTDFGRLSLAWSTVQDLSTIALIVVLSALAQGGDSVTWDLFLALGWAIIFLAVLIPVGLYVLPNLFERVASFRNREVFVLAVGVVVLGAAFVSSVFGVSIALGAFVAGALVGESDLSHQILGEIQPLRDILASLFFVSIGMLVDPMFVVQYAPLVAVTALLILIVKGAISAGLIRLFGVAGPTALLAGAALGQSAEFSFLMASVGADIGAITSTSFNAMLAGSALSMVLVPSLLSAVTPLARRSGHSQNVDFEIEPPAVDRRQGRHTIICGYGRVGQVIGEALDRRRLRYVVIEQDPHIVRQLRARGATALVGSAENAVVLERAGLAHAHVLIIAMPDVLAARRIVEQARQHRRDLDIVVRTHSLAELATLRKRGANEAILGELELALEMTRHTLHRYGVSSLETVATVNGLRERATRSAEESGGDADFWN